MNKPSVLLAVRSLLQSEIDVEVLLAHIVERISDALSADRATLFLVDLVRSELYSKAAQLPELAEIRLAIGQGLAGHVAATGRAISIRNAQRDQRAFLEVDATTGYTTTSVLAVPIFAHETNSESGRGRHVVGVLQVLNKRGGAFDDSDQALLEALAMEVGEALAVTHLDDSRERPLRFNKIIGASPAMRAIYEVVDSAASTDATVLILGESGTGKERVARAIHVNSGRTEGPFVRLDCTAIPEGLIEAELFGHEKGAFTGAQRRVLGKCELAHGGSLFLDELGELPLALQAKLLRFIQERELERVGGREVIKTDVRVIAATNRDLSQMVHEGQFRRDLYYRIKVVTVELPPLRERGGGDLELLARHFLAHYARRHRRPARAFSREAMTLLASHRWPGNIRELEHCVESAVVFCHGPVIQPAHLSVPQEAVAVAEWDEMSPHESVPSGLTLADVEKRYILRTLAEHGDNRTRTAEVLGIGRNTLARKLRGYGIA